jgi:hypothetical protein
MKKPKSPDNLNYWLSVIKKPELVEAFKLRGSATQKRNLERAIKYEKWNALQEKKEKYEYRKRRNVVVG